MNLELVSIPTDSQPLDGLIWHPEGPTRGTVLLFHGNTNNFYSGPSRFVPPVLVEKGFTCLAFNRRGHDILTTLEGKRVSGGAFQTAAEGIADNEFAYEFVTRRGYADVTVLGYSNGGMLAAQFAADHPELKALVLMSAHGGGPEIYLRTCAAGRMAGDRAVEFLETAREMVAEGRAKDLLLMPHWWNVISAESLVDRHENTPDLFVNAPRIQCPALFLVGDQESAVSYPAERFADVAGGQVDVHFIPGGDHWYTGVKEKSAALVADWLTGAYGIA
jgi:pimeloyl-ACP methyl ester carboxylesterase